MWNRILVAVALTVTFPACKKQVAPVPAIAVAPAPVRVRPADVPPHVETMVANFHRVYFDFDSSALRSDAKQALVENAGIMTAHPDVRVEVQGHCDERGTVEYNRDLGERRAKAVKDYLAASGVASSRVTNVSYGEEKPLEKGANEAAWSKNRRAEFVVAWGGALAKGTAD